jgi:hypothetical protein
MLVQGPAEALRSAAQAKRLHLQHLMSRRNVVACGVGFKESAGRILHEPCVVVSVTRKLPKAQLAPQDLVPKSLGSVKTDVQEVGVFRAWQPDPRARYRPAMPGVSCGHADVTAGTLGCLVHRAGELFILSNNHVLANTNQASQGDPILQPGRYDGGTLNDQIALLETWIPLQTGVQESDCPWATSAAGLLNAVAKAAGSSSRLTALQEQAAENQVDCAIARPLSADLVRPDILDIGVPRGMRSGLLGMDVQKSGRTTGHTTGKITQVDVTVQVDYQGQWLTFVDQFVASGMSAGGDSGSAVLDMDEYVVGLLFAGSDVATLINPIQLVLSALNVQLVTG